MHSKVNHLKIIDWRDYAGRVKFLSVYLDKMGMISGAIIEPKYGINVGYIARTMKNFGLDDLYLVNPSIVREQDRRFSTHWIDIFLRSQIIRFNHLKEVWHPNMHVSYLCVLSEKTLDAIQSFLQNSPKYIQMTEIRMLYRTWA
jgi:tRNA C32,U32 (ribose-2'-O)-methylase TrmJ